MGGWRAEFWHAAILAGGIAIGLVFALAVTGIGFAIFDSLSAKRRQRRRILRAAGRCRWCNYSGDLAQVALHEAQDHAERSG